MTETTAPTPRKCGMTPRTTGNFEIGYKTFCPSEQCDLYAYATGNTEAEAIAAWNRRATPPALHAAPVAEGWRSMDSAPKDGTVVLLYCPQGDGNPGSTQRITAGSWASYEGGTTEHRDMDGRWTGQDDSEGWEGWETLDGGFSEDTMMPTRWMPLPPAPGATPQAGEGREALIEAVSAAYDRLDTIAAEDGRVGAIADLVRSYDALAAARKEA